MKPIVEKEAINHLLETSVEEIIDRSSIEKKLYSGKKLIVKLGADPSLSDLHLGHAVVLRKLKEFQDLGHKAVFVIGDFTAMIGDPSGRTTARKALSRAEIDKNSKTYLQQVSKILDVRKAEVRRNSEWFSKMKLVDFLGIAAQFSLRRLMDREDFKRRIAAGKEVGLHEALYQVLQAYDSVVLGADVELGGRDQKVNILAGRELQKKLGLAEQDVVIMPLLIGTDGRRKMSKSFNNFIGLSDTADDMFGKVMSIPDSLISHYAELGAFLNKNELNDLMIKIKTNPYEAKIFVAEKIAELYWGKEKAAAARNLFRMRFSQKGARAEAYEKTYLARGSYTILDLVMKLSGIKSKSEARRLIVGSAVELDHKVVREPRSVFLLQNESIVRIGKKKFFRIIPE